MIHRAHFRQLSCLGARRAPHNERWRGTHSSTSRLASADRRRARTPAPPDPAGRSRARRRRPLPACPRPTTPQPAANAGAASPPPQLHAAGRQRTGGREQRRADGELCAVAMEAGETEQKASARAREAPAKPAAREGARVRRRQACGKRRGCVASEWTWAHVDGGARRREEPVPLRSEPIGLGAVEGVRSNGRR